MKRKFFMKALKESWGLPRKELIKGKYRPVFSEVELIPERKLKKAESEWLADSYVIVPATRGNIRKQIEFNKKYATYSKETINEIIKKGEKALRRVI